MYADGSSPPSTLAAGVNGGSLRFFGTVGVTTKGSPTLLEDGVAAGVPELDAGGALLELEPEVE